MSGRSLPPTIAHSVPCPSPAGALPSDPHQLSLCGATVQARAARGQVYRALLSGMDAQHRFAIATKLVEEVLGGVVEGQVPLEDQACSEVLRDTLAILGSEDIKVSLSDYLRKVVLQV